MSIAKTLIERMDATIEVYSKDGEGLTFTLTIAFEIANIEYGWKSAKSVCRYGIFM
jgi:K+-sensing histidine kinase KdpD